ncbi:hypothetical protein P3W23_09185 [Luteibacter sp. PPL554]
MADPRKTLTLVTQGKKRSILLHCLKSERKSVVKRHLEDGTTMWMRDTVASQHADKSPKHLHIEISEEGIYEVFGQPNLSGRYCFYMGSSGLLNYAPVSNAEHAALIAGKKTGVAYRQQLLAMGKRVF